jgi:hypothetical protein
MGVNEGELSKARGGEELFQFDQFEALVEVVLGFGVVVGVEEEG